jgi:hypothetical protein
MQGVQRIERDGVTYALIFGRDMACDGPVRFVTEQTDGLQVGFFERDINYAVTPHKHKPRTVTLPHVAEFLSIDKGRVKVKIFDDEWTLLDTKEVNAGQCVVFLRGGHALEVLEPARIMEVKQGPYPGDDKLRPAA